MFSFFKVFLMFDVMWWHCHPLQLQCKGQTHGKVQFPMLVRRHGHQTPEINAVWLFFPHRTAGNPPPTPLPQVVVLNFFDDVKCHQVQVGAFSSKILPLLGYQQSTYATTASGHCNSGRLMVFIHSSQTCQHTIATAGWWFSFLRHGQLCHHFNFAG